MRTTYLNTLGTAAAAAAILTFGAAAPASAQSSTTSLSVSATVSNNCSISTVPLAFGTYDPVGAHASADLDGTGTVTVACTRGATATIGLGLGANAAGSTRRMHDGSGSYLAYQLFQDAGRSTIWGDAGGDVLSPAAAPSTAARNFTVYGRVDGGQDVDAGSYSDTVVATVNF